MTDIKPPRRPLWQRLLFGVSLGLNVLVIGAVAGVVLSGGRDDGKRPPPLRNGGVAAMIGVLPPEHREIVFDALRQKGDERGVSRRSLKDDQQQLVEIIRAETFDLDAFVDVLEANQARFGRYRKESHRLLADRLAEMSLEERSSYAERLSKFQRWHHRQKPKEKSDRSTAD